MYIMTTTLILTPTDRHMMNFSVNEPPHRILILAQGAIESQYY